MVDASQPMMFASLSLVEDCHTGAKGSGQLESGNRRETADSQKVTLARCHNLKMYTQH